MGGFLYILTGPSACGKTTLLNSVCTQPMADEMRAVNAPKFSGRDSRGPDDDVTHIPDMLPEDCDIAYFLNGNTYGIRTEPIWELLKHGLNPFIILSDFSVVRRVKAAFEGRAKSLYIASAIDRDRLERIQQERKGFRPNADQKTTLSGHFARISAAARLGWWHRVSECMADLTQDWRAYATDEGSTAIRAERIRAFHTRYIDSLDLFDHVILNYTENRPHQMTEQVRNLLAHSPGSPPDARPTAYPPMFVVTAASGAGKGELMQMLGLIGSDRIAITSKMAKRDPKPEDKQDGMAAIGPDGVFPPEYDMTWGFHKGKAAVEYAVSPAEIQNNIDDGKPQIFVSNMQQLGRFRERWGPHVVPLYLHRLASAHEIQEFQYKKWKGNREVAEARIAEIAHVHQDYIDHIADISHVLLNTTYPEDLLDQMSRLIEFYEDG